MIPPPAPVKPGHYRIPKWVLELRTQQLEFERKLAAPPEEYRPGYWRDYVTSRCAFCPSEITDQRLAYQGKVCARCAGCYGLGWPAVPALREKCDECARPFREHGELSQGLWSIYVIDEYFPDCDWLCPPCWMRSRFASTAPFLKYYLDDPKHLKGMRWHAQWALYACQKSETVCAAAIAEGGVRARAIRDAADQAWLNPVLCELIRFGCVSARETAIAFIALAKDIVADSLKLTPGALSDELNLDWGEDAEIDRLATADAAVQVE
jgi:hypothetical protein